MERAACVGTEPDQWFTGDAGYKPQSTTLRRLCSNCPVRKQCLMYAFSIADQYSAYGMFGGLTSRERRRIAKMSRANKVDIESLMPVIEAIWGRKEPQTEPE